MKKLIFIFVICCYVSTVSCKKPDTGSRATLALIQYKWKLISHNGEALRYVGIPNDYYDFRADDLLHRNINNLQDTFAYKLLSDNKTLVFNPVIKGIQSNNSINYTINAIENNLFIISSTISPAINILDSLKR
jgi:hypothetical protein